MKTVQGYALTGENRSAYSPVDVEGFRMFDFSKVINTLIMIGLLMFPTIYVGFGSKSKFGRILAYTTSGVLYVIGLFFLVLTILQLFFPNVFYAFLKLLS